ncbi:LacI family DNA-binding transcriptional regulator [Nocardia asteroides]|uniref:LacI family DNA-binding transcriptional regulator n=1 Tax=Nocardia asteroides TaxID=1824 RepID=UPI0008E653A3|nr:LacI family DNA-binding transcriptional regulator [Nocardia asteroides]UGT51210.1 LacI family transcriptional regulator [Nocardia asteroides]SFM32136.1 transcriptional regulator, LacI family [Nocardia asteroides]VEG35907.1 Glucose-resistance amylase regulator [Nocardia asteroides]
MTAKRPTLADVAARAGVSTAVVSYVLNDGPRPVSEASRAKVIEAADELQYRPDRLARALRRPRRWRQVGLLVPDLTMPLYAALVGRTEIHARARDHLTMIGNTGYDPEREREFVTAFADVGIDGLIVVGAVDPSATSAICARARMPVVWVHNTRNAVDSPIVGADHVAAGRLAAEHLTEVHGCRDIAFVGGTTAEDVRYGDRETVIQRYRGFTGVAGESAPLIRTDLTADGAYRRVTEYLRTCDEPPHGMVVATNAQAAAALRAITDAGLDVPDRIRVVGFDASPAQLFGQITLTAVQQPIDAITQLALDRLLLTAPDPAETDIPTPMPVTVQRGESCGCGTT